MWNLDFAKLESLVTFPLGTLAIETGTFRGRGAEFLAGKFEKVITIELSEVLHREAKARLAPLPRVECLQGNSAQVLERILPTLDRNRTLFFFLDAHWSGDRTVDWESSGWKGYGRDTAHLGKGPLPSGPEQVPLLEELGAIARLWPGPAHILIDDTKNIPPEGPGRKSFAFQGEDWSHLSRKSVLAAAGPRLIHSHFLKNPEQYFLELTARA